MIYRKLPEEVELVKRNGDGTVTVKDTRTGKQSNIAADDFDVSYVAVIEPTLDAPGYVEANAR